MHRAESVGDIDLGHVGKSLCKVCAVFLLTDIKAQVLKQHYLARLQCCGLGLGIIADDIVCKNDLLTEKLGKALGNGSKRQLLLPLSLGLAEVGACYHGCAVFKQILDRRQCGNNALIAGYRTRFLVLGYIEITAQQHLLSPNIGIENAFFVVIHFLISLPSSDLNLFDKPKTGSVGTHRAFPV